MVKPIVWAKQDTTTCMGCMKEYTPGRKPRTDRRNFCEKEECQRLGARYRKQDWRRKWNTA